MSSKPKRAKPKYRGTNTPAAREAWKLAHDITAARARDNELDVRAVEQPPGAKKALEVGDFFVVKGYEEMAKAQMDRGWVVVYTNNSSHLLVATIYDEAMSDGEGIQGRLEGSFRYDEYGDDPLIWRAEYRKALELMVSLTLRDV